MALLSRGRGGRGGGGSVTETVFTPAVALFEHPEDATTLFEAADGGTEGLTVTLREPLEYGQDTSQWSIVGEQRYQGEASVDAQITGQSFSHASYAGEFATSNLPDHTGLTGPTIAYDTDENKFQYATGTLDWADVTVANWTGIFGADPSYRPWQPSGGWGNDLGTAGAYEYANEAALEANLTTNYAQWTGGIYNSNANVLWFDQSDGDVKIFGAVTAPVEGIEADPIHAVVDVENQRITLYYNLSAGGALTEADTLGDAKGAFDTAAEGLSSEYVGGADEDTVITRAFATTDQFSQADLRGLRLALIAPKAAGAAGNSFSIVARARFAGGAEVAERQPHILIYTRTNRAHGVRIELDADIQAPNEHGTLVDASSGALGNEWTFTAVDADGTLANRIVVDAHNRQIIYYAPFDVVDVAAGVLHDACNADPGVSARYFGSPSQGAHPFDGSLGRVNTLPQRFHGGQDYHAATANPEPLTITEGPTHAHTRLYTVVDGGIVLSLTSPAHDGGNGFQFETAEGALSWQVLPTEERIVLTIPTAGALASEILAAANSNAALEAVYFGTETGTNNVLPARFGRHEMLGGLDSQEIEIQYAFEADGAITNADTMGDVKSAWDDRTAGRLSFYYGGADANTEASRRTPWEHEFENGSNQTINLSGFGLGPEQNEFTGADRAAAEAARDTYAAANPLWVEAYRGHPNVWIALRWGTSQVGQILRSNASNPPSAGDWIDQDLALKGSKGDKGDRGDAANVKDFAMVGGRAIEPGDASSDFVTETEIAADRAKLAGIEDNATADQTPAEIKTAYESNADTNAFDDAAQTKLAGIEANATADQSNSEIKTAYEANADTNALTDALLAAINNIESTIDARIAATRGNRQFFSSLTTYTEATDRIVGNSPLSPTTGDKLIFIMPTGLADSDDPLSLQATGSDSIFPFHDRDGNDLSANDVVEGRLYEVVRFANEYRILESPSESEPVPAHTERRYMALAAMGTVASDATAAMFTGANATFSDTNSIQAPASNTAMVLLIAVPADEGILDSITYQNDPLMQQLRGDYSPDQVLANQVTLEIGGVDHYIYASDSVILPGALGTNVTYILGQS